MSKPYKWNQGKNEWLKITRGISFEEIVLKINSGFLLNTADHPNKNKYPNQKIFMINVNSYIYMVPFVEKSGYYFLKTVFPSGKYTKRLLIKNKNG
jgi:hypothetical protein